MPPAPAANAAPPPTTVAGPAKLVAPRAAAASRAVPAATTGYCTEKGLLVSGMAIQLFELIVSPPLQLFLQGTSGVTLGR